MVKMQKYLFDTDFGAPPIAVSEMLLAEAEDAFVDMALDEVAPPSFSEEELTLAREQAHQAGHAAGLAEAENARQTMESMALASCAHHLKTLGDAQLAANQEHSKDAVAFALSVLRKVHPEFCRRFGLDEIESVLHDTLGHLHQVARVTITVQSDLVAAVRDKAETITSHYGFEGRLVVVGDPAMTAGDCRLDWGDGGAVRDQAKTWAEIERAVEGALGALNDPIADAPPAETL